MRLPPKTELDEMGGLPRYVWPGGYPIYYVLGDGETLCSGCAKRGRDYRIGHDEPERDIVEYEVNWEDTDLVCVECRKNVEVAYPEDAFQPDPREENQ